MSCEKKFVFYKNFPVIRLNNTCGEFSNKLDCDKCDIYKESYISSGGYNSTFTIKTKKCQNKSCKDIKNHLGVLRISHKYLDNEELKNEKLGLYLQSLFSTSKNKGGFGCKYICKVYDFGNYEIENISLAKEIFKCNPQDNNCKSITFNNGGNFSKGVYGILEKIPGGDLYDRLVEKIENNSYFREKDLAKIIGQLLIALHCMHSKGYVHLDIKPENILLKSKNKDDNVRLIDFGFVNFISPDIGYINPVTFGRGGTSTYKAPEINFDSQCNQKADIWSVGVTALVLLLQRTNYNNASLYPGEFKETIIPEKIFDIYKNELSDYSKECVDFLKKTIVWDISNRFDSLECLKHPWIAKNFEESKKYTEINVKLTKKQINKKLHKITSKNKSLNAIKSFEGYLKSWFPVL